MTGEAGCTDTVLIVDDSSYIVDGLIAFLKKKYRTLAAYGGAECLAILRRENPSVIILDIMMEPMDGWETLSRIKEDPRTRNIPVLMFSAKKVSEDEALEHRISIDDFITKPVSPKKILEAIDKVLQRRDANRKVIGQWEAAGISREKIDAYLALVTSLEVDLNLCQNMKIQYDLTHPHDRNQQEFQSLIAAIENRIQEERSRIDVATRELDLMSTRPGTGSVPAQEAVPLPSAAGEVPRGAGFTGREVFLTVPPAGIPGVPDHPDVPVVPARDLTERPHAAAGGPGHFPEDAAAGDLPDAGNGRQQIGPAGVMGDTVSPDAQRGFSEKTTAPEGAVPDRNAVPYPLPPSGPVPLPAAETSSREARQTDSAGIRGHETTHPPERSVVPADPDAVLTQDDGIPTGAGTDAPLPWGRRREGKRVPETGYEGDPVAHARVRPGFLTRVLALVTGLFRKK